MSLPRSHWTAIGFGLSLAFLAAYQQFKLPPVLPVLLETYGYGRTLAGGFMSVYAVAGLALSWLLGRSLARRGLGAPILGGLGFMVLGNALGLAAPASDWLMLAARALEGAGFAVLAIAGPVLANAGAAPHHLPIVIGLTASWIPVGQLIATALAPIAFAGAGWRLLWGVAIAATLAMILWTLRLRARGIPDLLVGGPLGGPVGGPGARPGAQASAAQRRSLALAGAVFMLWSGQYFAYMTWLPQYLVEAHGLSPGLAVAGYVIPVAILVATNLVVGVVLRAGAPVGPLFVGGLVSQVLVWWLVPVTGGGWAGIASLVVYGIGAGICPTCLFAMPSVIVGSGRAAAAAFGVIMTGRNLGVLVGPVLLAQAFEMAGGWGIAAPIFGTTTTVALGLGIALAAALGGAGYGTRR